MNRLSLLKSLLGIVVACGLSQTALAGHGHGGGGGHHGGFGGGGYHSGGNYYGGGYRGGYGGWGSPVNVVFCYVWRQRILAVATCFPFPE